MGEKEGLANNAYWTMPLLLFCRLLHLLICASEKGTVGKPMAENTINAAGFKE